MKKALTKTIHIAVDILIILILIISVLMAVLSLTSKSSGISNILGYAPLSVQTESMEDTLSPGDLIFCKVTNDSSYEYEEGDIVTFYIEINGESVLNTHRIVNVISDESITYYQTQGDNADTNPEPDDELQTSSTILARYSGFKIAGLGNIFTFIRTQLGFFLCVLLPMIIFFVYEAIRVVLNVVAYNKEKALEEAQEKINSSELTEEQKRKAVEEYLASIGEKPHNDSLSETVQTPAAADDGPQSDKS